MTGRATGRRIPARRAAALVFALTAVWTGPVAFLRAEAAETADVLVYGATPGGIVTAVRAAREGLRVVVVNYDRHIGGMMSNGLGVFDTLYDRSRAPLGDAVRSGILAREKASASPGREGYEPHVAERFFEELVARESRIRLLREYSPTAARSKGRVLEAVTFRRLDGGGPLTIEAKEFVDASYEGDLAKAAGVRMTVGRESRSQYGEPHAGIIFTRLRPIANPSPYHRAGLNLREFPVTADGPLPGSTGDGDRAIQAYNFRVCLTRNPADQRPVTKPDRYERDRYLALRDRWRFTTRLPNLKTSWNAPLLVGGNYDYPDGDWKVRAAVVARHRDLALGLLWFLQNDPAVPAATRTEARRWALPRDEFQDNGGFPWELYVREARRLVGRSVFIEEDAVEAEGLRRARPHRDSIAFTEWPLDAHSCRPETVPGSDAEGKVLLSEETRPGEVSYGCLLPVELDNLLVTVCLSASHVGYGAIRLEPTWMHIGESAGYAVALAHREGVAPAKIPIDVLQRALVAHGVTLGFFNDIDLSGVPSVEKQAAEFYGTRGYFAGYDACLGEPLSPAVAVIWAHPNPDPVVTARRVAGAADRGGTLRAVEFARLVGREWPGAPAGFLSRGVACAWLFSLSDAPHLP